MKLLAAKDSLSSPPKGYSRFSLGGALTLGWLLLLALGAPSLLAAPGTLGEPVDPEPTGEVDAGAAEREEPPPDAVPAPPEEHVYRRISLETQGIVWLEPGQRGIIEAHPLVMGLAAMALATVTLLFFFLRGVKRPDDKER